MLVITSVPWTLQEGPILPKLAIAPVAKWGLLPVSLPPLTPKLMKLIHTTEIVHSIMLRERTVRRISKHVTLKGTSWPIALSGGNQTKQMQASIRKRIPVGGEGRGKKA